MIKTILVPATSTDADSPVFTAALSVARLFAARLDFLHVRVDPAAIAAALASPFGGGVGAGSMIDRLEEEADQREQEAQKIFAAFCERGHVTIAGGASTPEGVSAKWHREIGNEGDWMAEYGRTSDLVVVGRQADKGAIGSATLEAALFDAGRPLLIPSSSSVVLETIAIAWKSTREAARAVAAARPFFKKARRIIILAIAEDGRWDQDSAERLLATLARSGFAVEIFHKKTDSRETAEVLLATAIEMGVGLLVMGGYGHSRLRELVFGGVTARVIEDADLPVLMAH